LIRRSLIPKKDEMDTKKGGDQNESYKNPLKRHKEDDLETTGGVPVGTKKKSARKATKKTRHHLIVI